MTFCRRWPLRKSHLHVDSTLPMAARAGCVHLKRVVYRLPGAAATIPAGQVGKVCFLCCAAQRDRCAHLLVCPTRVQLRVYRSGATKLVLGDQVFDVRGVVAPHVVTRVAGSHLTSLLLAGHRRCARVPVPGGMYGRGVLSAASWCNAVLYAALPQAAVADTGSGEFTSLGRVVRRVVVLPEVGGLLSQWRRARAAGGGETVHGHA